ncbi:aldo/keto reductase, partial [Atractiella rhizophila]
MSLTARPVPIPDEQAFEAIKTAIDSGATFLNSSIFYGYPPDSESGLRLLNRFFTQYPEYADRCVLSVKGALNLQTMTADCSTDNLRKTVLRIQELLGPNKRLDLFEPARVDKNIPIEQVMKDLKGMVEDGLFDYIGLSEASANTIRRAHGVCPISVLEEEYSAFSLHLEQNEVLQTCKELGIVLAAYSPLSRGLLGGVVEKPSDLPEGDLRSRHERFQPENLEKNAVLIKKFKSIASKKGITPPQLALAWILKQWPEGFLPIPGTTRANVVLENLGALNVVVTNEEDKEIR